MKLFVDDTRKFPQWGYECCRDVDTALLFLSIMDFEYISLDYSLGDARRNGLYILKWMYENNIYVPEINIHSNNIFGREEMRVFCEENFPESKITMRTLPK